MKVDIYIFELVRRRAQYPMYLRYRINKAELTFLLELSGFLLHLGRRIISKKRFFDTITGNSREKAKMEGYYHGCLNGGFIALYEYKPRPGSLCLGITELGLKVIKDFEVELKKLMDAYSPILETKRDENFHHTPKVAA